MKDLFSNLYSILKPGSKVRSSTVERSSVDLPEREVEEPCVAQEDECTNSQTEEYGKTKEVNKLRNTLAALREELRLVKRELDRKNILYDVLDKMYTQSKEECAQKDQIISGLEKALRDKRKDERALGKKLREYEKMSPQALRETPVYGEGYWQAKYDVAVADMDKAVKRAEGYKKRVKMLESKLCQIDGLTGVPDPRGGKLPCFYFAGKCYKGTLRDLEKRLNASLEEEEEKRKQKDEALSLREKALKDMELELEERKQIFTRIHPDYVWVMRYKDEIQRQKKILEGDLEKLAPGFTLEKYDELLRKKAKYEKEKSDIYSKWDQLKQDRRSFEKERSRFDREVAAFKQSKICLEGEINQLLEKYDQLLFVLRSFYKSHGLYEILLDDYLSKIDGATDRRITRAYFLGDSVYEIARRESKSAESIRQVLAMVVDVIGGEG